MNTVTFKDNNRVQWTDGKEYTLNYDFMTKVVDIDADSLKAGLKAKRSMKAMLQEWMESDLGKATLAAPASANSAPTTANPTRTIPGLTPADMKAIMDGHLDKLDMAKQILWYRAENERIAAMKATQGKLSVRLSEKGAISVYGMGKFPVTLYAEQWEKIYGEELKGQIMALVNAPVGKVFHVVKGDGSSYDTTVTRKG